MTSLIDAAHECGARAGYAACAHGLRFLLLALALFLAGSAHALAHEGHDHGSSTESPSGNVSSPRFAATSEIFQLVGIVEGEVLVIYLDRADTNAPVTSATLEISLDGTTFKAEPQSNGTYELTAPVLRKTGSIAVVATIAEGATNDLLAADLLIPTRETAVKAPVTVGGLRVGPLGLAALAVGTCIVLLGLYWLRHRRHGLVALIALASGMLLMPPQRLSAHEGHDHGPDLSAASGNTPSRRADGSIFLPKPSQRLLEVRTQIVAPRALHRTVRLSGRVVANPNFSGVVQSTIQGRYQAPSGGVPAIGTRVKSGDVLGTVSPSFTSVDSSDMAQTLGDLDQKISIARTKLARQEQLLKSNVVAPAIVDEARLELDGLQRRRSELLAARVRPEELRAPVDGVIAITRVVSGQVVTQADRVFEIVEPSKLLVEALAFDELALEAGHEATGSGRNGASTRLRFLGRSRALQQQYSLMQFEVRETSAPLDVGTPVTVLVEVGAAIEGLFVSKAALAQAPNGQHVVFEHKEPEIFVPRAVRLEAFDNETVRITAGLAVGAKIVVRNATLVAQVR